MPNQIAINNIKTNSLNQIKFTHTINNLINIYTLKNPKSIRDETIVEKAPSISSALIKATILHLIASSSPGTHAKTGIKKKKKKSLLRNTQIELKPRI